MPTSCKWSLSIRFSNQNGTRICLWPIRATCTAHLALPYLLVLITRAMKHKLWNSPLCSFLHPLVTSSLWGPNVVLSTPFWTQSAHSRPLTWHKVTKQQVQLLWNQRQWRFNSVSSLRDQQQTVNNHWMRSTQQYWMLKQETCDLGILWLCLLECDAV